MLFIQTGLSKIPRHELTYGSGQDRRFTYNFFERFGGYYGGTLNEFRVQANYRPTAKFSISASETWDRFRLRSEEHTSELQSHLNLVCRLLLEKKKTININHHHLHITHDTSHSTSLTQLTSLQ